MCIIMPLTEKKVMENISRKPLNIEETVIAIFLGLMTLMTFSNVVVRYAFNSNILWGLEVTVFLFAWLVLLGSTYLVKIGLHIGVDIVLGLVNPSIRRILGILSALACVLFAVLLLKGAWDYWANFANLPITTGRWFPTGFENDFLEKGWYEVENIPLPGILSFLQDWFNNGEYYEKLPRLLPYFVLPLSMSLLLYRFIQAGYKIYKGEIETMIVSFELEDLVPKKIKKGK